MKLFEQITQFHERTLVITDKGERVTYGEFEQYAEKFTEGLKERELIFILCRNSLGSLLGYLSCLKKGIVPLMLEGNMEISMVRALIREYHPKYLLVPQARRDEFAEYPSAFSKFEYELLETKEEKTPELYEHLGLLLTTSGSTGSPKLVRQSVGNIEANAASIVEYLRLTDKERPVTILPMNYTYGLSVIHSHVMVGATILLTGHGVFERELWDFIREEKATSISGVPYTYEMLKRLRFMEMELPDLKTMTQAGGRLAPKLQQEYGEYALANGKKFVVMYGQTEATARMSYLPEQDVLRKCGSIGIAIPGGSFTLEDEDGTIIREPEVSGELVYRGENVTLGYAQCAADLSLGDVWQGVLHTGDMAKRDEDGYYYITGRKKRFVKIYGNRVSLDEAEKLLREQFDAEFACCGSDDNMKIFSTEPLENQVVEYLSGAMKLNSKAFSFVQVKEIPKNEAGKTIYARLEEMG